MLFSYFDRKKGDWAVYVNYEGSNNVEKDDEWKHKIIEKRGFFSYSKKRVYSNLNIRFRCQVL